MLNGLKTRNSHKVRTILNLPASNELNKFCPAKKKSSGLHKLSLLWDPRTANTMNGTGITSMCCAIA